MKKSILILFALSFIIGCEPIEVNVKDSFDFQIKSQYISINKTDTEILTFIDIFPNHIIEGTTYTFEYEIQEGDGFYTLENLVLSPGQKYEFSDLGIVPKYVAKIEGQHHIQTFIENDKGLRKEHKLSYQIIEQDFEFSVVFGKNENYINEYTDFILRLNIAKNEEATYKVYFKNIDGELEILDSEETINQNELLDLDSEFIKGRFRSFEVGNQEIEFVIESSNGIIKSQIINFKTLLTDFEVVMTPNPLKVPYRWDMNFTYFIKRPRHLEQEIEYYLYVTSTELGTMGYTINNSDGLISQGFEWSIGSGISGRGILKQLGVVSPRTGTVTFHFRDTNGAEFETSVDVEFYDN
jgi:hypothetical protein